MSHDTFTVFARHMGACTCPPYYPQEPKCML